MFGSGDGGGPERKTSVENKKKANSEAALKFLEKEKSENDGTTRKKKVRERDQSYQFVANSFSWDRCDIYSAVQISL